MNKSTNTSPKKKKARLWMNIGRGVAWAFISLIILAYIYVGIFTYMYTSSVAFHNFITDSSNYLVLAICIVAMLLLVKKPSTGLVYVIVFELVVSGIVLTESFNKAVNGIYIITALLVLILVLMIVGTINAYKYKKLNG